MLCTTITLANGYVIKICPDSPNRAIQPVDLSSSDDLLNGISGTNVSNDLVSITTTDIDGSEQEQFEAMNSQNDYIYRFSSVSDNAASDTLIESSSDSIALTEDTVTMDLNTDSTFL